MNKNIKRIIAVVMAIGTISAVSPVTNANVLTTKAYASTTNDTEELTSLKLETSSGSTIKLYSDNDYASSNKVNSGDVSKGDTYYAKTSESTVSISTDGPSSKYVKVFKGTSSSTKGKSISSDISLSSGTTTLTVRVYSSAPDSSVTYSDDSDVVSEYVIKVKCTGSDSSDSSSSSDSYDSIYLSKLSINGDSISLSDSKTAYTYNVASDVTEVPIKATPEDTSYTVTIDGSTVDDSDKYKKTVSLDKGNNTIKVEITDDSDNDRVYTLNITRGSSASTSDVTSTSTTTTVTSTPDTATTVSTSTARINQWVPVNDKWQYNDATGTPVKNAWMENHYLQADGNMATGWLSLSGVWYYLGTDGAKKTGWIKDSDGKYYYLNSDGSMAYNTTISGYKLGANGAWIK